ncbi:CHAT domain-containing protein [Rutstroemia sp. NJR-2017a WRK4]|nr:CHAT domain-containing protein [Rutstroemia sp. NJR-2017a WRK4]
MDDLEEAIQIGREAVDATPKDHPDYIIYLNNLGVRLSDRYSRTGAIEEAIEFLQTALYLECGQPLHRIMSARRAATFLTSIKNWQRAAKVLEVAIDLLPKVTIRSNSRDDLQYALQSLSGIASFTASVFLKAGKSAAQALDVLEKGRGIIASLTIDLRSDESELRAKYPALWSQYTTLRREIAMTTLPVSTLNNDSGTPSATQDLRTDKSSRRLKLFKDLENLETEIRKQPDFHRFHLAPSEKEILQLACYGPLVVFNTSTVSSEAFIITGNDIQHINLPQLDPSGAKFQDLVNCLDLLTIRGNLNRRDATLIVDDDQQDSLARVDGQEVLLERMKLLWYTAIHPVLDHLSLIKETRAPGKLPHIWWVGGGIMSLLPLHAAGEYSPASIENTMSHVISSYSSSLKALQFVRSKAWKPLNQHESKCLIVSMPTTPGLSYLNVAEEVTLIKTQFESHDSITVLEQPTKKDVLESFDICNIAHFACHGRADRLEPAKSSLLLGKETCEELTINDLDIINHDRAQIAYLSACSTAENKVRNLADESIHLASTFQLVGFPHVIGTLWGANDNAAVKVAGEFYRLNFQDTEDGRMSVSRALHNAVLEFRNTGSNSTEILKWAPFIHIGS